MGPGLPRDGARELLDVTGLVVAPGVVDIHSHADFTLLVDGRAQSSLLQGITTVAVGNCGHGLAPVEPHAVEAARMTTFCCRSEWEHAGAPGSFEDYLDALADARPAVNVVPLVPHGALRLNVAGFELRALERGELDRLAGMVREAMEAGAAGLSTGLEYAPGIAATAAELRALCEPVGAHGGLYATHCRNRTDGIVDAAREAVGIAGASGCRLQLSHFVRRPSSPADRGALERAARELALREGERAGVAVGFDVFPFAFGPTPLAELLPQERRAGRAPRWRRGCAAGRWRAGGSPRCSRAGSAPRCTSRPTAVATSMSGARSPRWPPSWAPACRTPRTRSWPTRARTSTTWSSSSGGPPTPTSTARCSTTATA